MAFGTANGQIATQKQELGISSEPYILPDTPTVLSMGLRVKQGFTFIWRPSERPDFVRPDGHIVQLEVIGAIPFL